MYMYISKFMKCIRSRFQRLKTSTEEIILELFLHIMPEGIRRVLASHGDSLSLQDLAQRAEELRATRSKKKTQFCKFLSRKAIKKFKL